VENASKTAFLKGAVMPGENQLDAIALSKAARRKLRNLPLDMGGWHLSRSSNA